MANENATELNCCSSIFHFPFSICHDAEDLVRAIIIGAGRGSRLKAMTENQPKSYATVGGRRILDWTLEAFDRAGLHDQVFIGGYQIERIRADYPQLTFAHNPNWQ